MAKAIIYSLSLALVVMSVASQGAMAAPICEGTYISAVNGVSPPIQGKVTGVSNPYQRQEVRVEVEDCGRVLVIHADGAVRLDQDLLDPAHYFGSYQGATVYFDVWSPDRLTGQIIIPGANGSVIYEMDMVEGQMPDFEGCVEPESTEEIVNNDRLTIDPERRREAIEIVAENIGIPIEKADRYISAARTVAKTRQSDVGPAEIMPGAPGCPIEFTGVKNCLVFPSDKTANVEVNVLLDANGLALPFKADPSVSFRMQVDDPLVEDYCTEETKYPPADQRLQFDFISAEEDGVIRVKVSLAGREGVNDGGSIRRIQNVEANYQGYRGRAEAAEEAYKGIGSPVAGRHE